LSRFEVREATPADSAGIRRLFARVFQKEMTEAEWRWKFEANPDGWFGTVAVMDGEVVGNYAGWPMKFLLDGRERLLFAVGDVATDPAVRGRRVFRDMTALFYDVVGGRGVPFCFGFPGARHTEVSARLVGSRTLFEIRERVVPCHTFPPSAAAARAGDSVGAGFDSLWEASSRLLTHAAVRDRPRVNWRFHARPTRYYRMVWLESEGEMRSWAALSVSGENALVADFLGREPDGSDLPALFSAAAAEARRMGASRLVFWETPGGPGRGVIAAMEGERRPAGFPVIVRTFDEAAARDFAARAHLVPSLYDMA